MIEFRLDSRSGVPTYLQLVQQVKQAVRLGVLQPGDQLPTVKEVVGVLAINPNTVLKAYRELDHEGLVEGRRGQGTFVSHTLPAAAPADHSALQAELLRWIRRARDAGFDEDGVEALFAAAVHRSFGAREEGA
jgi:GntR family transcriptional regulator